MANRAKEDEKNEKIIRGLLKLPANRRCINCNNLGPQYVCTNFWTFICTNCSGMHREFTHRVKSISMAKFTSQEVSALQEGGNERAKEIYFKDWDSQRYSFPDSSNMDRLREFIKHVYVDRRYSGGRQGDRPHGLKGDRDDSNENRKAESYRGGSRSPPYEGRYSPNYGSSNDAGVVKYIYGERSPGYDQSRHKRSSVHFEVVDDRVRDDKIRNTSQNRRLPDVPKSEGGRSPNHQKAVSNLSPPMVRPVRDILGDDVPQLQVCVSSTTKSNGIRVPDDSAQMKTTLSSSSISSTDANSEQLKGSHTESLIDFDADPGPPVSAKSEQSVPQQTANVTDNGGDWAAFDITGQKIPQMASNTNPLVTALAELSVLESSPAGNMQTGIESSPKPTGGGNLLTVSPPDDPSSNQPPNAPVVGAPNNQTWMPSPVLYGQGAFTGSTVCPEEHLPRMITNPTQVTTTGVSPQPPFEKSKSTGRKELPADFFTSLYPNGPVSAPALRWRTGLYPGFGYNMHPPGVAMPPSIQTSKSVNPFDLTGDPAPTYAQYSTGAVPVHSRLVQFLPVAAPQAALENMIAPGALLRTSSYGAPSPRLVSSQQSPYLPNASPGPFTNHQIPNDMHQLSAAAIMSLQNQGFPGPAYNTIGIDQHPQPGAANSFGSVGGNPFG